MALCLRARAVLPEDQHSQSVGSQHCELQLQALVECCLWLPCEHWFMQTSYTQKVKVSKPLKNAHFPQLGSMYEISKWVQRTCWALASRLRALVLRGPRYSSQHPLGFHGNCGSKGSDTLLLPGAAETLVHIHPYMQNAYILKKLWWLWKSRVCC